MPAGNEGANPSWAREQTQEDAMWDALTKSAARNIFYGGSAFFLVIFVGLTVQSCNYALTTSTDAKGLTAEVSHGKEIWERHSCINCHTLIGEGAYFAPELGNVWKRYGGVDDPQGARDTIKAFIKSQPSGVEGRRQMPNFKLTEKELDDLVSFFEWVSRIDTQNWPPNDAG
jgi:nitric oxide reductase subunit C